MALNGRAIFRICVAVAAGGFLAWHELRPAPQTAISTEPTAAAPTARPLLPSKPQTWKLGTLTLTECELGQPNSGLSTATGAHRFRYRKIARIRTAAGST